MERSYPRLELNMSLLRDNAEQILSRCHAAGIDVCGVIKGCDGNPEVARLMKECGASSIGTSRLEQIEVCRAAGIAGPYMLIRVPGISELSHVVSLADLSLQSERSVLDALDAECARQNRTHGVIVMADLGDLREGVWNRDEMVELCRHVEQDLPHVELKGVGVNLGCYGSIKPTPEKMNALLDVARRVETLIGRKLEIVSGGATSSFPLVNNGIMPAGINHLRIGENILLSHDLQVEWGLTDLDYLHTDTFTLKAEVLEVREKPSYPQGELAIDTFGNKPTYIDIGQRKRALLGFGRADVGTLEHLICREPGMTVIGGSSDYCIVDVTDCRPLQPGDIVSFFLRYEHMLYATGRNDMPLILIKNEEDTVKNG